MLAEMPQLREVLSLLYALNVPNVPIAGKTQFSEGVFRWCLSQCSEILAGPLLLKSIAMEGYPGS